jgi:NTP pyrophosphatase (non-canonical NTP hydrolase)
MKIEEYEKDIVDALAEGDFICWIMGICGEAGELIELEKKRLYHDGKDKKGPITNDRILSECGDILWYLTAYLHSKGFTLQDCIQNNADKLKKRHPNGWTFETAQKHLDETETELNK